MWGMWRSTLWRKIEMKSEVPQAPVTPQESWSAEHSIRSKMAPGTPGNELRPGQWLLPSLHTSLNRWQCSLLLPCYFWVTSSGQAFIEGRDNISQGFRAFGLLKHCNKLMHYTINWDLHPDAGLQNHIPGTHLITLPPLTPVLSPVPTVTPYAYFLLPKRPHST